MIDQDAFPLFKFLISYTLCVFQSQFVGYIHTWFPRHTQLYISRKSSAMLQKPALETIVLSHSGAGGAGGEEGRLAHPVTSPTMVTSTTIGRGICFLQLCNTTKYWTQGCITRVITAMNRLFGANPRLQKFKFKWLLNRGPQYNRRIVQSEKRLSGIYKGLANKDVYFKDKSGDRIDMAWDIYKVPMRL